MEDALTFEDVKPAVETSYPLPVASVFRRCRITRGEDLGSRHKNLIDLFETLMKLICIVQLQEARRCVPNLKERLPQKEKTLEFLRRPSLGGWVGLLRVLCDQDITAPSAVWLTPISEWYRQGKSAEASQALGALEQIPGLNFSKQSKTPNAEVCNALVTYRNKHLAHAAQFTDEELQRRLPILEHVLAYLLKSASFLENMTVFAVSRIEIIGNDQRRVHAERLMGTEAEPSTFTWAGDLELTELYATRDPGGDPDQPPLQLGPFLLWQVNDELKRWEVYFYNDAWRTKLEYLSYMSGMYYYHKELHADFQELLQLKLVPGAEEDAYRSLSPEERSVSAERHFKQGVHLAAQQKLEDAVLQFERSAEYDRRAETFVHLARTQMALGDPPAATRTTLQTCLDLDPDNTQAIGLLRSLDETTDVPDDADPEATQPGAGAFDHPTLVHALTPAPLRHIAWLWWLVLLASYYCVSGGVELVMHGQRLFLAELAGMLVCTVVFTGGHHAARPLLLWLKSPLSLQLDTMRLERFERWYEDQYRAVFGDLVFEGARFRVWETVRRDKLYWATSVAWLVVGEALMMGATGSLGQPIIIVLKRIIDFGIHIMWLYPCVRIIVKTTTFIYAYSHLPLKPMLTRINDEGMRSLGSLMGFNIALASTAFVAGFLPLSLLCRATFPGDLVALAILIVIGMVWSVGMPLMVRRAARGAKSRVVGQYAEHIEKAFDAFIRDPSDETLKPYEWLVDRQKVIQRLSTWPLSWKQTLILVVGSNMLLVMLCALYVVTRFEWWGPVVAHLQDLL